MVKAKTISIHAVQVPNPNAMKFEIPGLSLTREMYEFASPEAAQASPLAAQLFSFDYVDRVFFYRNFITVHRKEESDADWEEILLDLRVVIKRHLELGEPVILADTPFLQDVEPKNELEDKIRKMIDLQIRPATWGDGGDISFLGFDDGIVKVKLAGACIGCPFGPRTVKQGVEVLLKRVFPYEVKEVTSDYVDWSNTQTEITPGFDDRDHDN
ncbi:MAG: NifU family protein [Bacteroidia bacterium]|nr:NifU family protein [Bacteroidia bacterium]